MFVSQNVEFLACCCTINSKCATCFNPLVFLSILEVLVLVFHPFVRPVPCVARNGKETQVIYFYM